MKKLLLLVAVCCSFAVGYGVVATAYPAGGMYGRGEYRGYFRDAFDSTGTFVLPKQYTGGTNAINPTVNNATELINFLRGSEGLGGNAQQRTGASFIIQTMIGSARNRPPTAGQIAEWESRVRYAESQGRISWFVSYSFCINTYYQGPSGGGTPNDDAFFDECGTNTSIVFRNASGGVAYVIKRECANPVGNISPLPDAPPLQNFDIVGYSRVQSNPNPLPGEEVEFRHFIRNDGPTGTAPTNIWWVVFNSLTNAVVAGPANSGTYVDEQTRLVSTERYRVPAATPPGTQICRHVGWDPGDSRGTRDERGTRVCATVRYDFSLVPSITPVITSGGVVVPGNIAEEGDTITFNYSVTNNGQTSSMPVTCTVYGRSHTGFYTPTPPTDNTSDPGYSQPPHGCPRTFPRLSTTGIATEPVSASPTNRTICRSLFITPSTPTGGTADSGDVCVYVASKPYARVFGGDISAGNGLTTAPGVCTSNNNATIVGWNKRSAGSFAGAGTQFAALALNAIRDFSTSLGNPASSAPAPSGLAFANTSTSAATGLFGGSLGSAPCIPDYYADRPTSAPAPSSNLSSMSSGTYAHNGTLNLSGNVNPGQRIVIYVNGNVYINGPITYPGTWTLGNIPLLQLVVRGNIFIDNDVTRLDGVYIAQANGATGGVIHTCAAGATPIALDGNLFDTCDTKLEINGAFVANQVRLLRTIGTLSRSTTGETGATSAAGEVFNYNPTLWLAQPPAPAGEAGDYDAIISLPPVL